jgi:hypothetical protein
MTSKVDDSLETVLSNFICKFSEYALHSGTKTIVYAPPGSGKTTFINAESAGGTAFLDTDQFIEDAWEKFNKKVDSLEKFKSAPYFENEISWKLKTASFPHNISWVVTNLHNNFLYNAVRMGFTIIALIIPRDTFIKYSESRNDDLPFLEWYDGTVKLIEDGQIIHNVIAKETFGTMSDLLDKSYNGYGSSDVVDIDDVILLNDDNVYAGSGAYVRENQMLFCFERNFIYNGMGDEIESVQSALRTGTRSRHFNLDYPTGKPYMLDDMSSEPATLVADHEGEGQRKLRAMNVPIYAYADYIISIGASPGDHLLEYGSMSSRIIAVDKRPMIDEFQGKQFFEYFAVSKWREYVKMIPKDATIAVISDIRRDRTKMMPDDEWEKMVDEDNRLQFSWFNKLHDKRIIMFSFKYRPSRRNTFELIPKGDILLQPWVWSNSNETRIFVRPGAGTQRLNVSEYYNKLRVWNMMRYGNDDIQKDQERRVGEFLIEHVDMFDHHYIRKNNIYFFNFNISNVKNGTRERILFFLRTLHNRNIRIVGTLPFANSWMGLEWRGIRFENGRLIDDVAGFEDHEFEPVDVYSMGISVWRMTDILPYFRSTYDSKLFKKSRGTIGSIPFFQFWFMFSNIDKEVGIDTRFQTLRNSQTWTIRSLTRALRSVLHQDTYVAHKVRADVIESHGGTPLADRRVNGVFNGIHLAVSGHMSGLVFADRFEIIDMKRIVDTIEFNVKLNLGRVTKEEKILLNRLRKEGWMEEDHKTRLWHNYWEHVFGLESGTEMLKLLGVESNSKVIDYVVSRLERLSVVLPSYKRRVAWQAKEYLDNAST